MYKQHQRPTPPQSRVVTGTNTPLDSPISSGTGGAGSNCSVLLTPSSPCTTPSLRKTIPALNMRMKTFKRSSGRIQDSLNKCRSGKPLHRYSGCPRGSNLELLRKALQPSINREMSKMFQDYYELFSMAHENIRENIARDDDSRPEEFLLNAMTRALEEAKKSFISQFQTTSNSLAINRNNNKKKRPVVATLDAERLLSVISSEFDSLSSDTCSLQQNHNSQNLRGHPNSLPGGRKISMQWSLSRINPEALFTLGSRANKALGLGTTRGRLYIKHPEIFKYPADQMDKQWLAENGHMTGIGGRVYLVFTEDLLDLAESKEYKNMPGVNAALISGFKLPGFILNKARQYMTTMVQYIRDAAANASVEPITPPVPPPAGQQPQLTLNGPLREVNNGTAPSFAVLES